MQASPFQLLTALSLLSILAMLLTNRIAITSLRRRIARDLHDDLGASLSNINLLTALVERSLDQPQQAAHYLGRIRQEASKVQEAVGDTARMLGPNYRQLSQLAALINRHGHELFEEQGIHFSTHLPDRLAHKTLPAGLRRDLYLILKEALHNSRRHAGARRVELHFEADSRYLYCWLRDDGRGFAPAGGSRGGSGLNNMRRRAALLSGALSIQSSPGSGCSVLLQLPASRWMAFCRPLLALGDSPLLHKHLTLSPPFAPRTGNYTKVPGSKAPDPVSC
jgi:signal transduction histidine kinase